MKTVDIFLQELIKNDFYRPNIHWEHRDKKILESLGNQLKTGVFFTENQGNLLLKILKDYRQELENFVGYCLSFLDQPSWSKDFRLIDIVRNISISDSVFPEILIEFSYNKKIKDKLFSLTKLINGDITHQKNSVYSVPLTEGNILVLIKNFKEHNFNFDEKMLNFYEEIQKIKNKNDINFNICETKNDSILKKLEKDIGSELIDNPLFLHDRKIKFQYSFDEFLADDCLKNLIAKRQDTDIFISSRSWSFEDILIALNDLKRLPLLVIFDSYRPDFCKKLLDDIHQAFVNTGLNEKVGIYFRLDNTENKDFNLKIANLSYNAYLDTDTMLVGLSSKQLPKFILKSGWKPKSVVCFAPNFKNTKIYSYCDTVDLKICYTDSKPVTGFEYAIM